MIMATAVSIPIRAIATPAPAPFSPPNIERAERRDPLLSPVEDAEAPEPERVAEPVARDPEAVPVAEGAADETCSLYHDEASA